MIMSRGHAGDVSRPQLTNLSSKLFITHSAVRILRSALSVALPSISPSRVALPEKALIPVFAQGLYPATMEEKKGGRSWNF